MVADSGRKMVGRKGYEGVMKLMVKLPLLRGELQLLYRNDDTMRELSEAYQDATEMLSTLRGNPTSDRALIAEYEAVCVDIETDVVNICSDWRRLPHG